MILSILFVSSRKFEIPNENWLLAHNSRTIWYVFQNVNDLYSEVLEATNDKDFENK